MRLVLATRNAHKADEFSVLLAPHEVVPLPDEVVLPPETGQTFAENALGKARAAAQALNAVVIADDSGIESAALGGRPGVYSARFAGEDATDEENLAKLLAEAPEGSELAYVCAIALVDPAAGTEELFEGRCTGVLTHDPRGTNGFGYDPAFVPDDQTPSPQIRTMAELAPEEKGAISHRGRAASALRARLGE
ncbi:MAG: non-canonical purine pyrophosphatase [Conexibacter sp.]|nr:non-canonical purine pyrophosphatase [Conexibacter sp.]